MCVRTSAKSVKFILFECVHRHIYFDLTYFFNHHLSQAQSLIYFELSIVKIRLKIKKITFFHSKVIMPYNNAPLWYGQGAVIGKPYPLGTY